MGLTKSTTPAPSVNTASISVDMGPNITTGYVASIISANPCLTTFALVCTDPSECSESSVTNTVTHGQHYIGAQATISEVSSEVSAYQSCTLEGPVPSPTKYACVNWAESNRDGVRHVVNFTSTYDASQVTLRPVPITANGAALASVSGTCTMTANPSETWIDAALFTSSDTFTVSITATTLSSFSYQSTSSATASSAATASNSASSSSASANGAVPTAISQICKVIVPVGAAVVAGAVL